MTNYNSQEKVSFMWKCFSFALLTLVLLSISEVALAQPVSVTGGNDPIGEGLCNIIRLITGKVGKAISTIAVIFLGVGLFLGKISWGLAIAVGIGIAGIFGAEQIVSWISGDGNNLCASTSSSTGG